MWPAFWLAIFATNLVSAEGAEQWLKCKGHDVSHRLLLKLSKAGFVPCERGTLIGADGAGTLNQHFRCGQRTLDILCVDSRGERYVQALVFQTSPAELDKKDAKPQHLTASEAKLLYEIFRAELTALHDLSCQKTPNVHYQIKDKIVYECFQRGNKRNRWSLMATDPSSLSRPERTPGTSPMSVSVGKE